MNTCMFRKTSFSPKVRYRLMHMDPLGMRERMEDRERTEDRDHKARQEGLEHLEYQERQDRLDRNPILNHL